MPVELQRAFQPVTHDFLPCFTPWHLGGTIPRWHIGNDWLGGHKIQQALALEVAGLNCMMNTWVGAQENEKWHGPMWLLSTGSAGS